MKNLIRRLKKARKKHGLFGMFVHLWRWRSPFSKVNIYCVDQIKLLPDMEPITAKRCCQISEIPPGELDAIIDYLGEHTLQNYEKFFTEGKHLWLVYTQQKFAYAGWTVQYERPQNHFYLPFDKGQGRLEFGFLLPRFRGMGLFPKMLRAIVNPMLEEGTKIFYTEIAAWNVASIKGVQKADFRFYGTVWELSLGSKKWYLFKKFTSPNKSEKLNNG